MRDGHSTSIRHFFSFTTFHSLAQLQLSKRLDIGLPVARPLQVGRYTFACCRSATGQRGMITQLFRWSGVIDH